MELYLIRHGQSQNNANAVEHRVADPGLTSLGEIQAKQLGDWAKQWQLDRVFTSPFLRTLITTKPIYDAIGICPEVRIDLHEIGGCYRGHEAVGRQGEPGLKRSEIEAQFGYRLETRIDERGWWNSQPYETWEDAKRRARKLIRDTQREFGQSNEKIAYVMHADIKMLIVDQIAGSTGTVPFNTSFTRLEVTTDAVRVAEYNGISHLLPGQLTI